MRTCESKKKRRVKRIALSIFCAAVFNHKGKKQKALMQDVSERGAKFGIELRTDTQEMRTGDELSLQLSTPYGESSCKGKARWVSKTEQHLSFGIEFTEFAEDEKNRLRRFIGRKTIKQAIDAIAERDTAVSNVLYEMLSMGHIDLFPCPSVFDGDQFNFLFEGQKVSVNKYLYISQGTALIEQSLLVKYGERHRRYELVDKEGLFEYKEAAGEIHKAGLEFMVTHEIDHQIARISGRAKGTEQSMCLTPTTSLFPEDSERASLKGESDIEPHERLICLLKKIKQDKTSLKLPSSAPDTLNEPWFDGQKKRTLQGLIYTGMVDVSIPACFMRFQFSMDTLMQVADMNLEFFHVRFLLELLVQGMEKRLFACVVDGRILGLVYIGFKEDFFYKGLEIKFIATLRGMRGNGGDPHLHALKGVGTFLMAGLWLLWKSELPDVNETFLDSEIEARHFYESAGFQVRRNYTYVLKTPKGYFMRAIVIMASNSKRLGQGAFKAIRESIKKQVKELRTMAWSEKDRLARKLILANVKECLQPWSRAEFAETALTCLIKHRNEIPEAEKLIGFGSSRALGEARV